MAIWALADLHLALGAPEKRMDIFGGNWVGYIEKMASNWQKSVSPDDLVLLAGDISWAMHVRDAALDLQWIESMPGTKVMIRGNHDYWWESRKKLLPHIPPSIHLIHNNAFHYGKIGVAGSRLWDSYEYNFDACIEYKESPRAASIQKKEAPSEVENEKIFLRELGRLELSLKELKETDEIRIAMTHYPPIGPDFAASRTTQLLEKYKVDYCIFGHIHSVRSDVSLSGEHGGIKYIFAACDFLNGQLVKVC
jgi:predicted phosphohydrolase